MRFHLEKCLAANSARADAFHKESYLIPDEHYTGFPNIRGQQCGQLVISLDFELYWGVRQRALVKDYFPNILGARRAIPALLDLFTKYSIHATWATVGFLFFDQTRTLLDFAPRQRPEYSDRRLDPYSDLPPAEVRETSESIFFAPSLIRLIAGTAGQEIATHTFSHYFCLEEGQNIETFRQDLLAARAAGRQLGLELRSLVFPQNEFRAEYIRPCVDAGITAYRGNPPSWVYQEAPQDQQGHIRRLGRLADAYLPLTSGNCRTLPIFSDGTPVNVPASRFLRPYSPTLRAFERLRLRRIIAEMSVAARKGLLYHLWWHPHNFGLNTEDNLAFLRKILDHYRLLRERYGFASRNMGEVADACLEARPEGRP